MRFVLLAALASADATQSVDRASFVRTPCKQLNTAASAEDSRDAGSATRARSERK